MTLSSGLSIPPSICADASVMIGAVQLLSQIETLPPDATGVLTFEQGVILVESRKICWAAATNMKRRLSQLLRKQRSPPLEIGSLEQLVHDCQSSGRPLGESLLAAGHVSEEGYRSALFSHITEAVACIAQSGARYDGFTPQGGRSYDPRFVFTTADVLSSLGGRNNRALAAAAKRSLRTTLVPDARGLAFLREDIGPTAIAVEGRPPMKVGEIMDLCTWTSSLFDVASTFDEGVRVATGTSGDSNAVVAWRMAETHFVAVCPSRAAASLLMARVDAAFEPRTEVGS